MRARGAQLPTACATCRRSDDGFLQVRGPGLMVATVLRRPGPRRRHRSTACSEGRLILMSAGTDGTVLRWMPPLVVTAAEIDEALQAFGAAVKATA